MKSYPLFRAVLLSLLAIAFPNSTQLALAESIIVDHTCTDVEHIPPDWVNAVKEMVLHHTGQSHGRQVPFGLANLENQSPEFEQVQSEGGIPIGPGLKITRGQLSQYGTWLTSVGTDRYWEGQDGLDYTRRTLDSHAMNDETVNASLHTWCWHLRTWSESDVDNYLSSMEILEAEYPSVTFIYMTDTCDSDGDSGYNRWLRNEQIRLFCRDHDKVLFDFADLEAWSADGQDRNTYFHSASGLEIPYWHDDWRSAPFYNDGHINEAACIHKAKAMWWLLARIAGWSGCVHDIDQDGDHDGSDLAAVANQSATDCLSEFSDHFGN